MTATAACLAKEPSIREIKEAWPVGPLRQFVFKGQLAHERGIYDAPNSPYICSQCRKSVAGVYEPDWLCGGCRPKNYGERHRVQ